MPKPTTKPTTPAPRTAIAPALASAAVALSLTACFFHPRETDEIFDVPLGTGQYCFHDGDCDDGNACTVDTCVRNQDYYGMCTSSHTAGTPDDHEPCTIDHCEDGVPVYEPAPKGTPCGVGGALSCDGQGTCLGCGGNGNACGALTECLSWACKNDACIALPVVKGLLLTEQVPGDCASIVCDGNGGTQRTFNATDHMPVPGEPCLVTLCDTQYNAQVATGTPCGAVCQWAGDQATVQRMTCTAGGSCILQPGNVADTCAAGGGCSDGVCLTGCTSDADCGMLTCEAGACVP